jgi:hypothetical protein
MISSIHRKLGTAGFIISIVALVAALGGGAYAASGGLSGKQKKEVEKIAKKYAGKPGATGATGPAGAKGDTGAAGAKGDTGAKGETGAPGSNGVGTPGAAGKSVEARTIATGEPTQCEEEGGAEYEVEDSGTAAEICNGKEGSPWTVGGLPEGATETGVWTFNGSEASATEGVPDLYAPISFSVPLREAIHDQTKIHFVGESGGGECTGTDSNPTAPPGQLCIYRVELEGAVYKRIFDMTGANPNWTSVNGAVMVFEDLEDHAYGYGSWAVTGGPES